MPERHLTNKYNFAGPGTEYAARMKGSDFYEKFDYYLNNKIERDKIIERAYDDALNKYTWKCMANNLISKIKEISL